MMADMERIVRISSVAGHDRHCRSDWATMTPNARVTLLERMRRGMLPAEERGLQRVARVRRLEHHARRFP
jgi:hypothetical protein